jgi:hypothetical protein
MKLSNIGPTLNLELYREASKDIKVTFPSNFLSDLSISSISSLTFKAKLAPKTSSNLGCSQESFILRVDITSPSSLKVIFLPEVTLNFPYEFGEWCLLCDLPDYPEHCLMEGSVRFKGIKT